MTCFLETNAEIVPHQVVTTHGSSPEKKGAGPEMIGADIPNNIVTTHVAGQ